MQPSVAGLPRKDGRIVIDATNQFGPGMVVENSGGRLTQVDGGPLSGLHLLRQS